MKKLILSTLVLAGLSMSVFSQKAEEACVSCKDNKTDYEKFASALGFENQSLGLGSFATGHKCEATANFASAFGYNSIASGDRSLAAGYKAHAFAPSSFALGENIEALSSNAFIIGTGYGDQPNELLQNTNVNSFMIGFYSTKPTFFVSSSSGGMNKTGKIGIGNITDPLAKLHIKADNNEDASILLQPTGTDYFAKILFGENAHQIYGKPGGAFIFKSQAGQDFLFENGNVVLEEGKYIATDKITCSLSNKLKLYDNENGITIANGGNVGIKSASPEHTLEINGDMLVSLKSTFQKDIEQTTGYSIETSQIKAPDASGLSLTNQNGYGLFVDADGNVGVGTTSLTGNYVMEVDGPVNISGDIYQNNELFDPSYWKLNANNHLFYFPEGSGSVIIGDGGTPSNVVRLTVNGEAKCDILQCNTFWDGYNYLAMWKKGAGAGIALFDNGTTTKVGIGTTNPDYMLTVGGTIHSQEVKVTANAGADYVFDENYDLPTLPEIEDFIGKNNHLPDIPSAEQMKEEGLDLGDMQIKLLQKIEELTLYVIELKKENEEMRGEIEKLK